MAYITTQQVSAKRREIKVAFPAKDGWKFSVRQENHSSLHINIMQFPKEYGFPTDRSVTINQYGFDKNSDWTEKQKEVIRVMVDVAHGEDYFDESDVMTDYFHCAWYVNLAVGKWDRNAVAV